MLCMIVLITLSYVVLCKNVIIIYIIVLTSGERTDAMCEKQPHELPGAFARVQEELMFVCFIVWTLKYYWLISDRQKNVSSGNYIHCKQGGSISMKLLGNTVITHVRGVVVSNLRTISNKFRRLAATLFLK